MTPPVSANTASTAAKTSLWVVSIPAMVRHEHPPIKQLSATTVAQRLRQCVNLDKRDAGRVARTAHYGSVIARRQRLHDRRFEVVGRWNGRRLNLRLLSLLPVVVTRHDSS